MTLDRQICDALCGGFKVKPVPIGFAVASPFDWFTGDKMIFYARTKGALVRFEDSGSTVFELEGAGVDLSSSTRLASLMSICEESQVNFDQDECQFSTAWVKAEGVGLAAIRFMSFMIRVQDLILTTRSKVASTFKDELIQAVVDRFGATADIQLSEAPVADLSYYVVDIVVKHKNGRIAAIFPATSEEKALGAVLFAKELELKNIDNVVPFLVFENLASAKINQNTQAKAMNSELELANWAGGQIDVIDKIAKHVAA